VMVLDLCCDTKCTKDNLLKVAKFIAYWNRSIGYNNRVHSPKDCMTKNEGSCQGMTNSFLERIWELNSGGAIRE
jgi:hypothetical protein